MFIVIVSFRVKPDQSEAFKQATIPDVQASLQDPGVIRLDLIQKEDDLSHFVLHEVFGSRDDGLAHLEMAHFKQWQATIKSMLVEPPQATTYLQVYPLAFT